jgi:hypothetical protein
MSCSERERPALDMPRDAYGGTGSVRGGWHLRRLASGDRSSGQVIAACGGEPLPGEASDGQETTMAPIHSRADRVTIGNLPTLERLELDLAKAGGAYGITVEERDRIADAAALLGFDRTARRLRELNARRHGFEKPSIQAVPDDPRRPLKGNNKRAILVAVENDGAAEPETYVDPAAVAWRRIASSAEHSLLNLPLHPTDESEFRALAAAARSAALPRRTQPEEQLPPGA